tara:strand:- start:111075 stop:112334 length:1260 start_codon:yes stop_codon:yes gene_type:complete
MWTKLKAGSLQLVTFIVVIIALLLIAFILLIHTHKQYRIKTNHIVETVKLANSGVDYALQNRDIKSDSLHIDVDDTDYKTLKIHRSYWGTFEKIYAEATIKTSTLNKMALVGSKTIKSDPIALYLKDNNSPLLLVGQTKITGKAFLPKRGVKSGNIAGQSYYNENYIYGSTAQSINVPKLDKGLTNYIETISATYLETDAIVFIDLTASKTHSNAFNNPVQLAYSTSAILLSEIALTGHIVVQSKTKITIDSSSRLEDVILIAPEIEIKPFVRGTFQAFASERILVSEHVDLNYPSALVLNRDNNAIEPIDEIGIEIQNNATVKGNVIALGENLPNNYKAQIKIWPNAVIKGIIYCEQNLELRGSVIGTVYTNNFVIKESGSMYQNHVFNARINCLELESQFVSVALENSKKGIAKWLY